MNWLHNIRVFIISTLAVLLIVMAVSFSVMRALLPHATGYLEDIRNELELQLKLPVTIASLDADMNWLSPRLKIIDLIVYKQNGKDVLIHFPEANFSLSYLESLRKMRPVVGEIGLVGAEFFIERHDHNRWVVQGQEINGNLEERSAGTTQLIQALENINYSLLDSDIYWRDFTNESDNMDLKGVDVKIESFLSYRNIDIKIKLPREYGETMQITAELDGDVHHPDKLQGEVYINASSLILDSWLSKVKGYGDVHISGLSDASLWIHFSDNKIKKMSGELANTDIEISNPKHSKIMWDVEKMDFLFLYRKLSNGWRVDVDQLAVVRKGKKWQHESNLLFKNAIGVEKTISIDYLRLQDVLPLVYMFTDIENDETVKLLGLKGLSGDVYNTDIILSETHKDHHIKATVEDLAFNMSNQKIESQGIDGVITVENNDIKLLLDTRALRLDLSDTFREPIELDIITGEVEISSTSNGFSIRSPNIYAANADLYLSSRFEMEQSDVFHNIDMQVDFFDVNTKTLHHYYPVNVLSANLINWMDDAINEGRSEKGSFVFRGDPKNFPFYASDGVMEVDFSVDDLNLHYLDGWPNLKNLQSNIRFYNESLSIENGTGRIQDGDVYDVAAVIPDLNDPLLTLTGKAKSDAGSVQEFIWNSGLDEVLGNALKQFTMKGNTELDFYLKTPLGSDDNKVKVDGKLSFDDAQFEYPVLNYLLSDINGDLSFSEAGMSADGIKAKLGADDINIDIATIDLPDNHESVINISGNMDADILLNSFDWIPDAWVSGHSLWTAGIHIPYVDNEYSVRVLAHSQLSDVLLNVSDGIQKQASVVLPVEFEVMVFNDDDDGDLKINVGSKDVFKIEATRDYEDVWDADIESDIVSGIVKFEQGMNTDSTVYLNLDSLDLDALITRKKENSLTTILPTDIPSLEFRSKNVFWDDWKFSNVSLITSWQPQGMLIKEYKLESTSLLIDGQGSWLVSWQHTHESNFKINVFSKNLGEALENLGLVTGLKQSVLTSTSDWQWQADPYSFSWDLVKGASTLTLRDGVMQDISPGNKGRIVGLFNVLALPKRFSLDFSDVYKDGFAFDKVSANFKLESGNAISKRIDVKASAADIRMFGRIGMQEQDYDLEVLVKPHSKGAAFTGGTIIGGPVLGAGLVMLQNLFKLDELAYDKYKITGPWDQPTTTHMSKAK